MLSILHPFIFGSFGRKKRPTSEFPNFVKCSLVIYCLLHVQPSTSSPIFQRRENVSVFAPVCELSTAELNGSRTKLRNSSIWSTRQKGSVVFMRKTWPHLLVATENYILNPFAPKIKKLCVVIFLMQGKFEFDHSWEWKGQNHWRRQLSDVHQNCVTKVRANPWTLHSCEPHTCPRLG